MNICFAASKSGGHIIPCVSLAKKLKEKNPNAVTFLLTGSAQIDTTLGKMSSFNEVFYLSEKSYSGNKWLMLPFIFCNVALLFFQTLLIFIRRRPHEIIATGGFIAIPVCLAAWFLMIPIHLYELNATPGRAISILVLFARKVTVCFATARHYFPQNKTTYEPYPVAIEKLAMMPAEAREKLGLAGNKKTIFILGGSQGSLFLNRVWKHLFLKHSELLSKVQVIHQTGAHDETDWKQFYAELGVDAHPFIFSPQIGICYAAADLVVCRAGAGTLFELEEFQVPYIAVPLPARLSCHQIDNARAMVASSSKHAYVLLQEDIERDPELLWQAIFAFFYPGQPSGFASKE